MTTTLVLLLMAARMSSGSTNPSLSGLMRVTSTLWSRSKWFKDAPQSCVQPCRDDVIAGDKGPNKAILSESVAFCVKTTRSELPEKPKHCPSNERV